MIVGEDGTEVKTEMCEDCATEYREGDWPFCASPQNPEGHKRGAYGWSMASGMKGWTHMGSRSPR